MYVLSLPYSRYANIHIRDIPTNTPRCIESSSTDMSCRWRKTCMRV